MKKRFSVLVLFVSIGLIFSLVNSGCKKEEPKGMPPGKVTESVPQNLFKAQLSADSVPQSIKAGATVPLSVKVKNFGNEPWPAKTDKPVRLSYHWKDKASNKVVVWDGLRTSLPKDLAPGEEVTLNAKVEAPKEKGSYVLEMDMVQEKVAWFGRKGSETAKADIIVK